MTNVERRTRDRVGSASRCRDTGRPESRVNRCTLRFLTLTCLLVPACLASQSPQVEFLHELPAVLNESSGVAVSRQYPGILWTHNDSGHDPIVYAIDTTGQVLGEWRLESGALDDWEDMSLGPCVVDRSEQCLYIADIGDNMRQRSVYSVYIVEEPAVVRDTVAVRGVVEGVQRLDFSYPEGSRDAEGLAVAPSGDIYILTKGWEGTSRGYVISREVVERQVNGGAAASTYPVEGLTIETGSIPYMITGAAISPSGTRLVARTYLGFHFFAIEQQDGSAVYQGQCTIGYREPQGEAVDFWDESTLVLTSEALAGRPGTLHRVKC